MYLAKSLDNLYITKLLKLLYIIDEESIKESGEPVTWMNYNVWKFGPVNPDLHTELAYNSGENLSDYIEVYQNLYGQIVIPKSDFDDGEFSEFELEIIDRVIKNYGVLSSAELVDILHKNDTLWDKIVKEHNLNEKFKYEENNTSQYKIDFTELLEKDSLKKHIYQSAKESQCFINQTDCICEL